jgi:hypothetical protein
MPINNRGLAGQTILPYIDYRSYAGADVFLDLTFLDHAGVLQTPASLNYRLDDLTNALVMVTQTSITPTGSTQTIQIPGSVLQMSKTWQGSQLCQLIFTAVLPDTSTIKNVTILELCATQTPGGN